MMDYNIKMIRVPVSSNWILWIFIFVISFFITEFLWVGIERIIDRPIFDLSQESDARLASVIKMVVTISIVFLADRVFNLRLF